MNFKRVELEYVRNEQEGWRDRRFFTRCERVEFSPSRIDGYLYIHSPTEGDFYLDLTKTQICWLSIDDAPMDEIRSSMDQELLVMIRNQQLIPAIKRCREITGYGLKEAKEYVEKLRDDNIPF